MQSIEGARDARRTCKEGSGGIIVLCTFHILCFLLQEVASPVLEQDCFMIYLRTVNLSVPNKECGLSTILKQSQASGRTKDRWESMMSEEKETTTIQEDGIGLGKDQA